MRERKYFSQNFTNNPAQCAICVLKVPTALQNNLQLMCLQQNTQNTCDVRRRSRLETRKNVNGKYFVTFKSSPLQSTIIRKRSVHQCNNGHYGYSALWTAAAVCVHTVECWQLTDTQANLWHWENAPSINC